jgi:hypothetical protein
MDRSRTLTALAVLGVLGGTVPVSAQQEDGLRFDATLGVHQSSLSDVRDAYHRLVQLYQGSGLTLPIQREFPANLLIGAEVTHRVAGVALGVSADYTWTRAFALYGDTTGRLDLMSTVKMTTLQALVRAGPVGPERLRKYAEARVGVAFGSVAFAQTARLFPPIGMQATETLSASGTGPTVEGAIGVEYGLGTLRLGASVGYRYAKIGNPRGTDVVDGRVQSTGSLPFDLNASGMAVRFRIGRSL